MSLPPVAPEVTAAAVESLTSRLLKKLDAAVEQYGAAEAVADGDVVRVRCGEDAVVTLAPDASGVVASDEQASCTCLLAPKCLHRAAVLTACPVADSQGATAVPAEADAAANADGTQVAEAADTTEAADATKAAEGTEATQPIGPGDAQVAAAAALWSAAASILAAGIPAAGAVPQAELLRAAHTARLAGLHRPEAAALRVVRNLRAARSQSDAHRLGDLVADLVELLLTAGLLAAANPDPDLVGTARRAYEPGGSLRVHGVCREPVLSATGYGGVVTHVLAEDGHWFTVPDVKPGGAARARGAATAPVAIGASTLDHNQLSRGGLLIAGATVSADGRLGAGKGVRATPLTGQGWSGGPLSALFAKPLGATVRDQLTGALGAGSDADRQGSDLLGCEVVVIGASGDCLLVREVDGSEGLPGPLIRLVAAHGHPDFAHAENLRRLAAHPGLRIRVVGRLDPDRTATLRPLAVGPTPDAEATLRLPESWQGHADLGYDRLQGAHFPPPGDGSGPGPGSGSGPTAVAELPDLVVDSPLWRLRHIVELAVSGGRRTVAEFARTAAPHIAHLRQSGLHAAADRVAALAAEADRRDRDVFGRLTDPDPGRYAQAWLAAGLQLAATERALVRASWEHSG